MQNSETALHPEVHPEPDFDSLHRFSAWLARIGRAEATIAAYHADIADLVRAFAPRPAEDLFATDITIYLSDHACGDGWSVATTRRHLQAIKAFYRYLVSEEALSPPGPAEGLPEPVSEPAAPYVISEDGVDALMSYLAHRAGQSGGASDRMDLALYGLCYHAALLVSEAIGLTMDSVRGDSNAMELNVVGRRGEESRVTIQGDAARWLSEWLAARPEPKRETHAPFVFIHPITRLHTSRQRAWDRLKRLARSAGLGEEIASSITPHTLRHSLAAHLVSRAATVSDLRAALRQHSPRHAAKYLARSRDS